MNDAKKTADKLYDEDEFTQAYKYYAQLVANYPKDAEYNYRLGVCMIYSEEDKKKCLPYLKQAALNTTDAPKDVFFYLGKAFHINYQFDEAIKNYEAFKKTATPSLQKKLQVDREIAACKNGKRLLSNLTNLEVTAKKQLNELDYFRTYDLKTIGGKLLVKPEEFRSVIDKKKKEKSIVYLPKSNVSAKIFYSSYGDNTETGKDIYYVTKTPNGFGPPVKVDGINSEFDEDYPFLHPNGKTLYFSSKGFNSMGGYDIFKSTYDGANNSWSTPENLEFPINSPDDDYLFVTDSLEQNATFSTGRQSPPGKIDVLKINTERVPIDVLAIKGMVKKEADPQGVNSFITLTNLENQVTFAKIAASDLGEYKMELPNGGKILYSVETPGVKTQTAEVILPMADKSNPYKQEITYVKGKLNIINHFDETTSEDSYLQYLDVIEKKAKLDVIPVKKPVKKPEIVGEVVDTVQKVAKVTTPTIVEEEMQQPAPQKTVEPVVKTEVPAKQNNETGTSTETVATNNEPAQTNEEKPKTEEPAQVVTNEEKTKTEVPAQTQNTEPLTKSNNEEVKNNWSKAAAPKTYTAATGDNLSDKQMADIAMKDAELTTQGANQLDRDAKSISDNGKNLLDEANKNIGLANDELKTANTIAEPSEKQVALTSAKENLEKARKDSITAKKIVDYAQGLMDEAKEKRKEAALSQKYAQALINTSSNKDNALAVVPNESGNGTKKPIAKKPVVKKPVTKAKTTKANVETTEEENKTVANKETQTEALPSPSTDELTQKYAGKIELANPNDAAQVKQNNLILNHYNFEVDEAIKSKKAEAKKSKDPEQKKNLNADIVALNKIRESNNEQLANNKNQLLAMQQSANPESANGNQLQAATPEEAIDKIEDIKTQMLTNDNENFDFNAYQNTEAQSLKVEADSKINDAVARQKKLKTELDKAVEDLKSGGGGGTPANLNAEQLNAEADAYHEKSLKTEESAKQKTGPEKTKLLAEAKKLEEKSYDTHLAASAKAQVNSQSGYILNQENISVLLKDTKSSELELAEAQKLQTDADKAFKQAQEIRTEADTKTNKAAKLGANYNAEEKEAEALLKQEQAINILKKSNPDVVLKTNAPVEGTIAESGQGTVQQKLDALNQSINEVATIKIDSYQKLSEANNKEVDDLSNKISDNIETIDKDPKLKSDMLAANNKLEASKRIKKQAEAATEKTRKASLMIAAVKKENEALKQLAEISYSMLSDSAKALVQKPTPVVQTENINQEVATNTENQNASNTENNTANQTETNKETVTDNTKTEPEKNTSTETETKAEAVTNNNQNNNTASENNKPTKTETNNEPVTKNTETTNTANENTETTETPKEPVSNVPVEDVVNSPVLKVDTNAKQVVSFFDSKPVELKNPAANKMFTTSLGLLKKYDNDLSNLEKGTTLNAAPILVNLEQAGEFKTQGESLTREGDDLSIQAIETKKEAQSKEGAEKDSLLAKSKAQENEGLEKNIQGADLQIQSNEIEAQNNSNMIGVYLSKLKSGKPELYNELEVKNSELNTLRTQIKKIVDEAKSAESKGAQYGGLSNAQEKEAELLQKQTELVNQLKTEYPDYVYTPSDNVETPVATNTPETQQKRKEITNKQFTELTKLTNALSLEFETQKYKVPTKLSPEKNQIRQNVINLNRESKRYLIQSSQQKDETSKMKYLSLSAKYGAEALSELHKILPEGALAANNTTPAKAEKPVIEEEPETVANNKTTDNSAADVVDEEPVLPKIKPKAVKAKVVKPQIENDVVKIAEPKITEPVLPPRVKPVLKNKVNAAKNLENITNGAVIRVEGLEVRPVNAYSEKKPIPFDAKIEDGLVFRVQIGAFRNKLPNNAFRGLSPLNAETTPNGFYRYTAGNFNKFELANAVKNDLRSLGYSDAFVVGFYNGKRIGLTEALDLLTKEGKTIDRNSMETAGISANTNVPRAAANTAIPQNVVVSKQLEKVNGLLYTIQVGVFNRQVTKQQLFNLRPIFSEELPSGLFRYTAGIYNNVDRLVGDKRKVNELGLRDAFVTAYLNGKRIGFGEAKDKQANDATVKMETEEPVIFPAAGELVNPNPAPSPPVNAAPQAQPLAAPFTNGVKEYPAATAENGVKKTDQGVTFKVQIGAFSKQVPNEVATKFNKIKNWPVESKLITSLYIYSIGNFSSAAFAKTLKNEAISLGIEDAFIVVYKDGVKLYGEEARKYMSQ